MKLFRDLNNAEHGSTSARRAGRSGSFTRSLQGAMVFCRTLSVTCVRLAGNEIIPPRYAAHNALRTLPITPSTRPSASSIAGSSHQRRHPGLSG